MCQSKVVIGIFVILQGVALVLSLLTIVIGSISVDVEAAAASQMVLSIGVILLLAQTVGFFGVLADNICFVGLYISCMLVLLVLNSIGSYILSCDMYDVERNREKWIKNGGKIMQISINQTFCGSYGSGCVSNLYWLGVQNMITIVCVVLIVFNFILNIIIIAVSIIYLFSSD